MEILPQIHVGRSQTMDKSLMTENLVEANQVTKREERFGRERERQGCVCLFLYLSLCLCQGVSDNERGKAEKFLSGWEK